MSRKRWVVWVPAKERRCGYERLAIAFSKDDALDLRDGYQYITGLDGCKVLPEAKSQKRGNHETQANS